MPFTVLKMLQNLSINIHLLMTIEIPFFFPTSDRPDLTAGLIVGRCSAAHFPGASGISQCVVAKLGGEHCG